MRNIYDNSEFFAAYAEMGRSKDGLNCWRVASVATVIP